MKEGSLLWCFRNNVSTNSNRTDKYRSRFAHYYDEIFGHLQNDVTSLLEIGINRGGSICAWRDFFVNATIYGIDIRGSAVRRMEGEERVSCHKIDVEDVNKLNAWATGKTFDIVIDDGSHRNDHQIIAFENLWPLVKPGGYFVIEDTKVAWNSNRINPNWPLLEDYLVKLYKPITRNELQIHEMIVRPNMTYFRKKRIDEFTVETTEYAPINEDDSAKMFQAELEGTIGG